MSRASVGSLCGRVPVIPQVPVAPLGPASVAPCLCSSLLTMKALGFPAPGRPEHSTQLQPPGLYSAVCGDIQGGCPNSVGDWGPCQGPFITGCSSRIPTTSFLVPGLTGPRGAGESVPLTHAPAPAGRHAGVHLRAGEQEHSRPVKSSDAPTCGQLKAVCLHVICFQEKKKCTCWPTNIEDVE